MSRMSDIFVEMQGLAFDIIELKEQVDISHIPFHLEYALVFTRFKRLTRLARSMCYNVYHDKLPYKPQTVSENTYDIIQAFELYL